MTQNKSVEEVVEEFNLRFGGVKYPFVEGVGAKQSDCIEYVRNLIQQERQTSQEREREIVGSLIKEFQDYKHQSENEYVHIDTVVHAIASAHNITLTNPNKD